MEKDISKMTRVEFIEYVIAGYTKDLKDSDEQLAFYNEQIKWCRKNLPEHTEMWEGFRKTEYAMRRRYRRWLDGWRRELEEAKTA